MHLKRASWDIVPEILSILRMKWPDTKTSYNILKGYSEIKEKSPDQSYFLLTPNGTDDGFGTHVIVFPGNAYLCYTDTLHPHEDILTKALINCEDIDWTKSVTFGAVHSRLFTAIENIGKELKLREQKSACRSFHLSNIKAREMEYTLPEDIYLNSLTAEHAIEVNALWPHSMGNDTLSLVTEYITNRKNIGIFRKDLNKLVAWCLHLEYGGPGLLHVVHNEKRKGYGEIALRAMTRYLGEIGLAPHCFILITNIASMQLFTKVGYSPGYYGNWYTFTPIHPIMDLGLAPQLSSSDM